MWQAKNIQLGKYLGMEGAPAARPSWRFELVGGVDTEWRRHFEAACKMDRAGGAHLSWPPDAAVATVTIHAEIDQATAAHDRLKALVDRANRDFAAFCDEQNRLSAGGEERARSRKEAIAAVEAEFKKRGH